jgi:hypothetical protein
VASKFDAIHRALDLPLEQLRPTPDQRQAFYRQVDGLRAQISSLRVGLDDVDTADMSKDEKKELTADKRELTQLLKDVDAVEEQGAAIISLREGAA